MKQKKSFTLAETLITLVIIGVISAITVPLLINNYNEQVTVSKVKKFNSTFANAINLAISANGPVEGWDLEAQGGDWDSNSANKFAQYIKPYLSIINDCGTDTNTCMETAVYKMLNGYTTNSYSTNSGYYKMILNDGSLIWFRTAGNECSGTGADGTQGICAYVWIDVNGTKMPNQIGKDTFNLRIKSDGIAHSKSKCAKSEAGWGCFSYIIKNGHMNYLHE